MRRNHPQGLRLGLFSAVPPGLFIVALLCGGCNKAPPRPQAPKTFPVSGKVVFKDGKPLTGGVIEFLPATGDAQRARGEIQSTGEFTLVTLIETTKFPGAVEGTYNVTVIPPIPADQNVQIFDLPQPFTVEPEENKFTITLDKPSG